MGVKMKIGHENPKVDIRGSRRFVRPWADDVGSPSTPTRNGFPDGNRGWVVSLNSLHCMVRRALLCEDIPRSRQTRGCVGIPIAREKTLGSLLVEVRRLLRANAVDILQPEHYSGRWHHRNGQVVTLADVAQLPVAPHHMMESTIHVACGVMGSGPLSTCHWVAGAFAERVQIKNGI